MSPCTSIHRRLGGLTISARHPPCHPAKVATTSGKLWPPDPAETTTSRKLCRSRPSSLGIMTPSGAWTGRTAWARNLQTPLRTFLRTETGSAAVLLSATVLALLWVNIHPGSYESLWHTDLSVHLGRMGITLDLREWVNSGLMTLFFFTVGLEARREFDMGELRERSRVALPVLAGVGGMLVPVAIFLAFNA